MKKSNRIETTFRYTIGLFHEVLQDKIFLNTCIHKKF